MKNTLFVDTANTCRSPMAGVIMRQELSTKLEKPWPELEKDGFTVYSAGLRTSGGFPISKNAVKALNEMGYKAPVGRSSKTLSLELVEQADHIYALTHWHLQEVLGYMPETESKISLLADKDIHDPIGGDLDEYRGVALEIQDAIRTILRKY